MYQLKISRPGSLLSVALDSEISEAQLAAIRTVLRIHDHDDEAPCYCAFQFPDNCNLTMLWADAQRRANVAEHEAEDSEVPRRLYPGSAAWAAQQPGYLPTKLARCRCQPSHLDPATCPDYVQDWPARSPERDQAALDQLGELGINVGSVRSVTEKDHEMMVANDTID